MTNSKQVKQAKQLKRDYEITFSSPEGKRVLHDLAINGHVLETSYNLEPTLMAYNEGARNFVLRILTILKYKPEDFITLSKET